MGGILKDRWSIPVTAVADEFIDTYMAAANGEYVKVYLYVLRHQEEDITIELIADALNHTESDVRRALSYWEKAGVMVTGGRGYPDPCGTAAEGETPRRRGTAAEGETPRRRETAVGGETPRRRETAVGGETPRRRETAVEGDTPRRRETAVGGETPRRRETAVEGDTLRRRETAVEGDTPRCRETAAGGETLRRHETAVEGEMPRCRETAVEGETPRRHGTAEQMGGGGILRTGEQPENRGAAGQDEGRKGVGAETDEHSNMHGNQDAVSRGEDLPPAQEDSCRPVYSPEQVDRLSRDEEFSQLLYIAQKYMNRVFTPRDCQVFAYLYEGLSMGSELLEYLVEYCVQNGHSSVRYIETVAINWHEKGLRTALEAKDYCVSYNRDSFAVMKAFGINSRKPATPEQKLMDKWFREYGFSREVVLEACGRTITAIHNPSFQYTDKILSDWKKAGVKCLNDVKEMDTRRMAAREESGGSREKRFQSYDSAVGSVKQGSAPRKNTANQFHNFKQRDTDYDALVLKQVKEWVEQQPF